MVQDIFMKPDYEEIIKELDMKSNDKAIVKIEPEDRSYDYYDNSNTISFVHNNVSYKFIPAEDLEPSNINNTSYPPSTILLGVSNAEPKIQDIVPSEKLFDIKAECNSDFIFEEIDFSEDIKPYLLPVEPNVETDDEDVRECGLRFDPRNADTNVEQAECVDVDSADKPNVETDDEDVKKCGLRLDPGKADTNVEQSECVNVDSADSDEVDVTTVDNGFSALFRVECKKKLRRQRGSKRPATKHRQCSVGKKVKGRTCRVKNKGRGVKQSRGKKETVRKTVPAVKANSTSSSIPVTSCAARARIKKLIQQYIPSTSPSSVASSFSSRTSSSSSRSSSPCTDQLDEKLRERRSLVKKEKQKRHISSSVGIHDEKLREKRSIREKERRNRNINLLENLRLLIPKVRKQPKTSKINILTFSRMYIDELKQNLKEKQKSIKYLRNKKISILKELNNLIEEFQDHSLNSR